MDFYKLFDVFKNRCKTVNTFIRTKTGRNLFLAAVAVFLLMFVAPLFQGAVGAALMGCVASPLTVMIWRRYDYRHAIVPAVFFCAVMILDMIIYHTLSIAVCLLVAVVCTLTVAIHPAFESIMKIKDIMYYCLACGGVCVGIVVLASMLILLVSIAWWLFCLFLFIAIVVLFFTVVLSTAAYTATDDKRQQRKKQRKEDYGDDARYNFDTFAQDIGLKNEYQSRENRRVSNRYNSRSYDNSHENDEVTVTPKKNRYEPLYYDVDQ